MSDRTRSKTTGSKAKPEIRPVTFSPYLIRRHRSRLAEWVKANGLNPNDIPLTHPIRVEDGDDGPVIRYVAYARTEEDVQQADSIHSDEVPTVERTAPCTVPPPDLGAPAPQLGTADEAGE